MAERRATIDAGDTRTGSARLGRQCVAVAVVVASVATLARAAEPAAADAEGKKIFTQAAQPTCALCHTLDDAGASGNIGPNLDELKPDAERVRRAVKEGFGNMPSFGESLSDAQIEAVSQYVARATAAR